jgi:hypothetical protein
VAWRGEAAAAATWQQRNSSSGSVAVAAGLAALQLGAALEISLRKKSFQTLFFLTANL